MVPCIDKNERENITTRRPDGYVLTNSKQPHGKGDEGHRKFSRFFGGSTTKKRQRLVMITSSGRIVLAPAGGEEKKAKLEISLLTPDCSWKTLVDAKGQTVWCVDSVGSYCLDMCMLYIDKIIRLVCTIPLKM